MSNKISALSKRPYSHPRLCQQTIGDYGFACTTLVNSSLLDACSAGPKIILQWYTRGKTRKDLCPVDAPFTRALVDVSALITHIKHAHVSNACGTSASTEHGVATKRGRWRRSVRSDLAYPPLILQRFAFLLWASSTILISCCGRAQTIGVYLALESTREWHAGQYARDLAANSHMRDGRIFCADILATEPTSLKAYLSISG